ncbi:MAG: pyridoxamine 5'-phosphate oxidase family protein [Steroidobacteraceae bacterium]
MHKQKQSDADLEKLADLIEESRIAMLTTAEPDGTLRSRPLATLQLDARGALWFFTSASSPKVDEIERHRRVNLSYVNPGDEDYVSISGIAETVRDRAKMRELWTPWVKPWFPRGLDDPDLVLLKVTIEQAEYWDAPDSAAKRLYGLAKALATGETDALGRNAKISR